MLAFPCCMLGIVHFCYQSRLLMIVWEQDSRQNNNNFYDFDNSYFSEMMKLFVKFYFLTMIFFVSLDKLMLVESFYLCCVFALPLVPQLLLNFGKRRSRQPSYAFLLVSTCVHITFPCYFLLFKDNFLSLRPQPRPLIHVIIPIQAAMLVLLAA